MLSNMPPVLPILKQPGLIPPTYNKHTRELYHKYQNTRRQHVQQQIYPTCYIIKPLQNDFCESLGKKIGMILTCTYSCWADNSHSHFLSFPVQLPGLCFRNSFSDDGDRANLQMATPDLFIIFLFLKKTFTNRMKLSAGRAYLWKLHSFKGSIISRAKRGKVDHNIGIWMFVRGFGHIFVHCKKKPSQRSMINFSTT